jgi:hypothetical protein
MFTVRLQKMATLSMYRAVIISLFILSGCTFATAQIRGTAAPYFVVSVDNYTIPQYVTSVGVTGNFTKTSGVDSWTTTGVYSTYKATGNCSITFKATSIVMAGLSNFQNVNQVNISYAIYLFGSQNVGFVAIYELGQNRGNFSVPGLSISTELNYTFRVERYGNEVRYYYQNGAGPWIKFYTSTVASTGTLYVSSSMYSTGTYQNTQVPSYVNFISNTGFVLDSRKYKRIVYSYGRVKLYQTDTNPVSIVASLPTEAVQN